MNFLTRLKNLARNDHAESSIMQTITIAVSAILIAAGVVTAPNLINAQRENTAKTQLGNLAFAEQAWISAKGFVNDNTDPNHADGSTNTLNKAGNSMPSLAHWKYPYDLSSTAIVVNATAFQPCKDSNQYYASIKSRMGNVYYVTSGDSTPSTTLVKPKSCEDGYVSPSDSTPTSPDRITAPTGIPTTLAFSGTTMDFLNWTGVTCTTGSTPAYQIRAKISGTTYTGAWSNAVTQPLDFLQDKQKASGAHTTYVVAAKCRSDQTADLSAQETVSTQNFSSDG